MATSGMQDIKCTIKEYRSINRMAGCVGFFYRGASYRVRVRKSNKQGIPGRFFFNSAREQMLLLPEKYSHLFGKITFFLRHHFLN